MARPDSETISRSTGTLRASRLVVSRSVSKVLRSRLLMPTSGDFSGLARSRSSAVCTSSSAAMPQAAAAFSSSGGLGVGDAGEDDQDAVGAERAGFRHLPGVVEEVLAQDRQVDGGARLGEVAVVALEARAVGQHAEAGGAAGGVGGGERGGVEVVADQALGRARLLDLGDQRRSRGPRRGAAPRRSRAAGRRRGRRPRWRPAAARPCAGRRRRACRRGSRRGCSSGGFRGGAR